MSLFKKFKKLEKKVVSINLNEEDLEDLKQKQEQINQQLEGEELEKKKFVKKLDSVQFKQNNLTIQQEIDQDLDDELQKEQEEDKINSSYVSNEQFQEPKQIKNNMHLIEQQLQAIQQNKVKEDQLNRNYVQSLKEDLENQYRKKRFQEEQISLNLDPSGYIKQNNQNEKKDKEGGENWNEYLNYQEQILKNAQLYREERERQRKDNFEGNYNDSETVGSQYLQDIDRKRFGFVGEVEKNLKKANGQDFYNEESQSDEEYQQFENGLVKNAMKNTEYLFGKKVSNQMVENFKQIEEVNQRENKKLYSLEKVNLQEFQEQIKNEKENLLKKLVQKEEFLKNREKEFLNKKRRIEKNNQVMEQKILFRDEIEKEAKFWIIFTSFNYEKEKCQKILLKQLQNSEKNFSFDFTKERNLRLFYENENSNENEKKNKEMNLDEMLKKNKTETKIRNHKIKLIQKKNQNKYFIEGEILSEDEAENHLKNSFQDDKKALAAVSDEIFNDCKSDFLNVAQIYTRCVQITKFCKNSDLIEVLYSAFKPRYTKDLIEFDSFSEQTNQFQQLSFFQNIEQNSSELPQILSINYIFAEKEIASRISSQISNLWDPSDQQQTSNLASTLNNFINYTYKMKENKNQNTLMVIKQILEHVVLKIEDSINQILFLNSYQEIQIGIFFHIFSNIFLLHGILPIDNIIKFSIQKILIDFIVNNIFQNQFPNKFDFQIHIIQKFLLRIPSSCFQDNKIISSLKNVFQILQNLNIQTLIPIHDQLLDYIHQQN